MEKREYIEGQLLYIAHPYGGDETNKERVQTYLKMLQSGICRCICNGYADI